MLILLNYVPYVLSCLMSCRASRVSCLRFSCVLRALSPTCFVPHVPFALRAIDLTCLVLYVTSNLTCLVPYALSCLTCLVPYVLSCFTCPSCLLLCVLHVSVSPFLLLFSHTSRDFFLFISNSLAFLKVYDSLNE